MNIIFNVICHSRALQYSIMVKNYGIAEWSVTIVI